jgi:formate dehydrogenase
VASTTETFCRICEPLCGLTSTVEDGRLIELRPSGDHPISQGFACPKGIAMSEIVNDPDRPLYPLRRKPGTPPGPARPEDFERVSWDVALDEIAGRLRRVIDTHGGSAVGSYVGNPAYFSYSAPMWMQGFLDALGSKHLYTPGSQDTASRFAASALLYGTPFTIPLPDLYRTDFLLMVGANPLVSHGSMVNAKRLPYAVRDIPRRGGRLVVVDPRRTETAKIGEHIPIRPDTDAWMLLAMLNVIFAEGLQDDDAIARQTAGADRLRELCAAHSPESAEARTRVPADTIRRLARDLAAAPTRGRLRPLRLQPRPPRHARRLPARRPEHRHRQPRPRGRRHRRRLTDPPDLREEHRHLRRPAHPGRELPRRVRPDVLGGPGQGDAHPR